MSLDTFTHAYIEAMLWAGLDDNGMPFDSYCYPDDIAPKARAEIDRDCAAFYRQCSAFWEDVVSQRDRDGNIWSGDEQAGHDFYLTRNHHGVGFWDRPEVYGADRARELTKAANVYGTQGLYRGDDGKLYTHG